MDFNIINLPGSLKNPSHHKRVASIKNYVAKEILPSRAEEYACVLHCDMLPLQPIPVADLCDNNKVLSIDTLSKRRFKQDGIDGIELLKDWSQYNDSLGMGWYDVGILHIGDIKHWSNLPEHTVERLLAIEKLVGIEVEDYCEKDPEKPGIIQRGMSYLSSRREWVDAGKPMRPEDKVKKIFEVKCKVCKHYNGSSCNVCGCFVNDGMNVNKIAWATTECPDDPPQWGKEKVLAPAKRLEQEPRNPPPQPKKKAQKRKKKPCGCGK
jgi:hypothetical protein